MTTRAYFDRMLDELRDNILLMGSRVGEELKLAVRAYDELDLDLAADVFEADKAVNQARFDIEEECFTLIVTQQPAARDLRAIVTAMNVIVDLERMGDQAKGIAKIIPHLLKNPQQERPQELMDMAEEVGEMLDQSMVAYANGNVDLARVVAQQDDKVDALYARVFTKIMDKMAATGNTDKVEAAYELLRVARELERFGDLATNIAERTIYLVTGNFDEVNLDHDED
jgi:phosphate transport system protein